MHGQQKIKILRIDFPFFADPKRHSVIPFLSESFSAVSRRLDLEKAFLKASVLEMSPDTSSTPFSDGLPSQ